MVFFLGPLCKGGNWYETGGRFLLKIPAIHVH